MHGKWVAKALIQKTISLLPNPQRANYFFQHHVTRSTTLSDDFLGQRIGWTSMHLDTFDRMGGSRANMKVVELGTGWYPIVPLCYFLAGAEVVWMLDLEDLTRPELVLQAVEGLLEASRDGRLDAIGIVDERLSQLEALAARISTDGHRAALESIGLKAIPGDARTVELPDPPDLITSNTVFEHVDPTILEGILRRFATVSRSGTVMSHLIDHCDHYAYMDENVGVYHFLRYSDRAWRLINNSVQPMNRLRASEYVSLYERAGVPILEDHRSGCDPTALIGEPLSSRFKAMDPADVSCTASHLVSRFD